MKLIVALLGVILLYASTQNETESLAFGSSILNTAKNVTKGIISKSQDLLPTPMGLFETGKQLIAGYPFEFVSSAINSVCSVAISAEAIVPKITPDIKSMSFQLMTPCQNTSFSLLKADEMWKSPNFDKKKKTILLATGWTTTINETDTIYELSRAYFCRGDVNFVAVDAASYVDTLYTWAALNTEEIGESIGRGLVQLAEIVPLENIHLIGHSLGSHIVGAAGRTFNALTGKLIPRITGLDPAKPCFNEGENLSGLQRGDAEFVDVIHSNPGVLGKRDPLGDADFYPGGLDPLPPGCFSVTCAHARAWKYFTETVYPGNEDNFMSVKCNSLTNLKSNKCPGNPVRMGYAASVGLKGNYFSEVNIQKPYGKNAKPDSKAWKSEICSTCLQK